MIKLTKTPDKADLVEFDGTEKTLGWRLDNKGVMYYYILHKGAIKTVFRKTIERSFVKGRLTYTKMKPPYLQLRKDVMKQFKTYVSRHDQ